MRAIKFIVAFAVCFSANAKLLHSQSTHSLLPHIVSHLPKVNVVDKNVVSFMAHNSVGENNVVQKQLNSNLASEILAGFVVSLATIPKAIAYSSVLGVSPLTGIWTSVIVSLFTTLLGDCPGTS